MKTKLLVLSLGLLSLNCFADSDYYIYTAEIISNKDRAGEIINHYRVINEPNNPIPIMLTKKGSFVVSDCKTETVDGVKGNVLAPDVIETGFSMIFQHKNKNKEGLVEVEYKINISDLEGFDKKNIGNCELLIPKVNNFNLNNKVMMEPLKTYTLGSDEKYTVTLMVRKLEPMLLDIKKSETIKLFNEK